MTRFDVPRMSHRRLPYPHVAMASFSLPSVVLIACVLVTTLYGANAARVAGGTADIRSVVVLMEENRRCVTVVHQALPALCSRLASLVA